ncbi:MAG: class I SAM-dependent methyltransferase [Synechococcales cyanobacterium CRU_2_2]|nr:class I SAM-dependent methyltransferase [Synechococcales cyanobacterium CRU_2_2]
MAIASSPFSNNSSIHKSCLCTYVMSAAVTAVFCGAWATTGTRPASNRESPQRPWLFSLSWRSPHESLQQLNQKTLLEKSLPRPPPGFKAPCHRQSAPQSFDVITYIDVTEHLSDPLAELRQARQCLKPGGKLLLYTGNAQSPFAHLAGANWAYLRCAATWPSPPSRR